jgi:hypothetical protein
LIDAQRQSKSTLQKITCDPHDSSRSSLRYRPPLQTLIAAACSHPNCRATGKGLAVPPGYHEAIAAAFVEAGRLDGGNHAKPRGANMMVIGPDDNSEYVRRLATAVISRWDIIPESVRADILMTAVGAIDPASTVQTYLEQDLKKFIIDRHAILKG